MESSNRHKGLVYDEVRRIWVIATPEERVRQKLLRKMVHELSYPRELISVEKSLSELCASSCAIPARRVDIACFAKRKSSLDPILVIECKEDASLTEEALSQVKGYNHFLKAVFIAIAHPEGEVFGYPSLNGFAFLPYLPRYQDLLLAVTHG